MNDKELLNWADKYRIENEHPQHATADVAWLVGKLADLIRELKGSKA